MWKFIIIVVVVVLNFNRYRYDPIAVVVVAIVNRRGKPIARNILRARANPGDRIWTATKKRYNCFYRWNSNNSKSKINV